MPNPYLEKIAHWKDVEPGVFQNSEDRNHFEVTDVARRRIAEEKWSPYFASQKVDGRNIFGALGAGVGGLLGTSPLFGKGLKQRALNTVLGAGVGYGLGALAGHGMASAGNNQWRNDPEMVAQAARDRLSRKYADWEPIKMDTRE